MPRKGEIALIVLCRLVVGAVFMVSGWAKAVDPWGFIFKVEEYIAVWGAHVPREVVLAGCVALSAIEFSTGLQIATGCFKRAAVWIAAAMMAFMLPLTVYIAIANPVSDCGCFGDFMHLSNTATLAKNIVITALIVLLIKYNRRLRGFYPAPVQWLVIVGALGYPLVLSFIGYQVQPVVDFRPFPLGSDIFHGAGADEATEELYVYEKGGQRSEFALDALPDSTWTFVETTGGSAGNAAIAVRDSEGDDVADDILDTDSDAAQAWLIITAPDVQFLSSARFLERLNSYFTSRGVEFIAIAAGSGAEEWRQLTRPEFDVYSAEDTALKELVRGDAALIYTRGGVIKWKSTLAAIDRRVADDCDTSHNFAEEVRPVDDGKTALALTGILVVYLLVVGLLGQSPKMLRAMGNLNRRLLSRFTKN
ncbi:MAG: DoxX family protein [Muribaculaceae bacterium]|nr:DoxX family protein [Muribaculaceae bacterium]